MKTKGLSVSILSSFPFPEGKATANRLDIFAKEFAKNKYVKRVNIIAIGKNEKIVKNYKEKIDIHNILHSKNAKNKIIKRFFNEIICAMKIFKKLKNIKTDILIVSIPSPLLLLPIILNHSFLFLVLDIRDATWEYLSKSKIQLMIKKILLWILRLSLRKVKLISVTNQYERKSISKITQKKILIVPNGISIAKFKSISKNYRISKNTKLQISYIGNVGIAQKLDILLELAKKLNEIKISVIGDGARLEHLIKKKKSMKLKNINFTGLVNNKKAENYIVNSDILFLQIGKEYRTAIPSKIFEYVAAGKKALVGLPNKSASTKLLSKFNGITVFKTGDLEDLLSKLRLIQNTKLSKKDIKNNITILRNEYIRDKISSKFVKDIIKIYKKEYK